MTYILPPVLDNRRSPSSSPVARDSRSDKGKTAPQSGPVSPVSIMGPTHNPKTFFNRVEKLSPNKTQLKPIVPFEKLLKEAKRIMANPKRSTAANVKKFATFFNKHRKQLSKAQQRELQSVANAAMKKDPAFVAELAQARSNQGQ